MRFFRIFLLTFLFSICIVLPGLSFSEVKISLRNGREIIADRCRDSNGKLICEKMEGSFEIEKKDVLDIKGITIKQENMREKPAPESGGDGEGRNEGKGKPDVPVNDSGKTSGLTPEEKVRLGEIYQRKIQLKGERENLLQEREQLQQDIKSADPHMSIEKFEALQKRSVDLDTRLMRFSSELKALNEEETELREKVK